MEADILGIFLFSFSLNALQDEQKIKIKLEILNGKSIELKEINEPKIQVDGHLHEAVFTRVKIFYDSLGLYFVIDMDQPKETLVRRLSGRDSGLSNRDSINITWDTFAHLFNGSGEWRWRTKVFFYPYRLVGQLKKELASDDKSFSAS